MKTVKHGIFPIATDLQSFFQEDVEGRSCLFLLTRYKPEGQLSNGQKMLIFTACAAAFFHVTLPRSLGMGMWCHGHGCVMIRDICFFRQTSRWDVFLSCSSNFPNNIMVQSDFELELKVYSLFIALKTLQRLGMNESQQNKNSSSSRALDICLSHFFPWAN